MQIGTVKSFNEAKGFGIIIDSETNKEIFVHVTSLIEKVRENDSVTFEIVEGKKGLTAVEVRLI
jgi:cold shock protein